MQTESISQLIILHIKCHENKESSPGTNVNIHNMKTIYHFICMSILPSYKFVQCLWRSKENTRSPGAGVTDCYSQHVGAGN